MTTETPPPVLPATVIAAFDLSWSDSFDSLNATAEHEPGLPPLPTIDQLAAYLGITATSRGPDVDAALTENLNTSIDYQLGRLSYDLMEYDGANPPATVPSPVSHAVLMYAAALYRRKNSVNGFDGYDDLGTVPVRGNDPDIERLVDRWRALAWA
jgi:hypothetical protein